MLERTVEGGPFLAAFSPCIGIRIMHVDIEAVEGIGRQTHLDAFYLAFIAVRVEGVSIQFVGFRRCHFRKLFHQEGAGDVVDGGSLLDDHIVDEVHKAGYRQRETVRVVYRIQGEVLAFLRLQPLISEDDLRFTFIGAVLMIIELV